MGDPNHPNEFQSFVTEFNQKFHANWDGFVWPFDTLIALGGVLPNLSPAEAPAVRIVCSCATSDYLDPVGPERFQKRLLRVMEGLGMSEEAASKVLQAQFS